MVIEFKILREAGIPHQDLRRCVGAGGSSGLFNDPEIGSHRAPEGVQQLLVTGGGGAAGRARVRIVSRLPDCGLLKVVGWKMALGAISCDTVRVVRSILIVLCTERGHYEILAGPWRRCYHECPNFY